MSDMLQTVPAFNFRTGDILRILDCRKYSPSDLKCYVAGFSKGAQMEDLPGALLILGVLSCLKAVSVGNHLLLTRDTRQMHFGRLYNIGWYRCGALYFFSLHLKWFCSPLAGFGFYVQENPVTIQGFK
jgi:hypothetical protein